MSCSELQQKDTDVIAEGTEDREPGREFFGARVRMIISLCFRQILSCAHDVRQTHKGLARYDRYAWGLNSSRRLARFQATNLLPEIGVQSRVSNLPRE